MIRIRLVKESEHYVDKDGYSYDDEGNVQSHGSAYGKRFGGNTYGPHDRPDRSMYRMEKPGFQGVDAPTKAAQELFTRYVTNKETKTDAEALKRAQYKFGSRTDPRYIAFVKLINANRRG
jgi:hypothetical protein